MDEVPLVASIPASWLAMMGGILVYAWVTGRMDPAATGSKEHHPAMETQAASPAFTPLGSTIAVTLLAVALMGLAACSGLYPGWVRKLFGPPAVELQEAYAAAPEGPVFDHAVLDGLLHRHVDAEGYVDYAGLISESGALDGYIAALASAPFDSLGRDEKLALLINAYNAFTLRLILDYWNGGKLASIRDIPSEKRWDDVRWNIGGKTFSLNQIEHELIRPNFREPRIHFALVCAAVSCPPLRAEAYTAAALESQLDGQARYSHTHDRWFAFDGAKNEVRLTMLYNPSWYGGDFEQVEPTVLDFAARYSPDLRAALDKGAKPGIVWIDYNWDLNAQK